MNLNESKIKEYLAKKGRILENEYYRKFLDNINNQEDIAMNDLEQRVDSLVSIADKIKATSNANSKSLYTIKNVCSRLGYDMLDMMSELGIGDVKKLEMLKLHITAIKNVLYDMAILSQKVIDFNGNGTFKENEYNEESISKDSSLPKELDKSEKLFDDIEKFIEEVIKTFRETNKKIEIKRYALMTKYKSDSES
jgi:hypothetical protein